VIPQGIKNRTSCPLVPESVRARESSFGGEGMIGFMKTLNSFVFPYKYLQNPEFQVSRNLLSWDSMVRNLN
jgi:hypothetical protein